MCTEFVNTLGKLWTIEARQPMTPSMHSVRNVDVVVIGAGIGGLSTALRLAAAGVDVAVLERADDVGGKMRVEQVAGRSIDAGPTVLTMRGIFDDLLHAAGRRLDDELTLTPLDVLARHAWTDGTTLDLHASVERSEAAIGETFGAAAARGYAKFHTRAAKIWERVRGPFLDNPRPGFGAAVEQGGWRSLQSLWGIDWHRSLWSALGKDFREPRLRQLFGRYATYYGSSPLQAPGTLALIAAVEQAGVWRIEGGMIALARALRRVLEACGGQVLTGVHVDAIDVGPDGARGVVLADGRSVRARAVVGNVGPEAIAAGAFGEAIASAVSAPASPRSLSAITVAAVARPRGLSPAYHTVLFSDDYPAEFEDLFGRQRVPAQPTTYLCASDRGGAPPDGDERLFLLVNAPPIGDRHDFTPEIPSCLDTMTQLMARCGLEITLDDPSRYVVTTPNDFARRFPHTGGALYGGATHSFLAPMRRPAAATKVPGFWLVGGGAHPGAGVPMVALGGRFAAEAVLRDLRSTSTSRSAATSGGTSTASATTAASPSR